jgi:DNA-binding GntR family transcriptional regulator
MVEMKLKVNSVVDALYDDLRHRILVGAEKPGAVLAEAALASQYQVARPTAKAAIERLVGDGLVLRGRRGAGASVRTLTTADIEDLYSTRIIIESAVNGELAERGAALIAAEAANGRLAEAAAAHDAVQIVAADVAFHRSLVAELGLARLTKLHDLVMGEAHFCMAQVQERQLLGADLIALEHGSIIEAIRASDSDLARERTAAHLALARTRLLEHVSAVDLEEARALPI